MHVSSEPLAALVDNFDCSSVPDYLAAAVENSDFEDFAAGNFGRLGVDSSDYLVADSAARISAAVEKQAFADLRRIDSIDDYFELAAVSVERTNHSKAFRNEYKISNRTSVVDVRFDRLSVFYFARP